MMGVLSRPRPGQNRRYAYGFASILARNTSQVGYPNHTHFIGQTPGGPAKLWGMTTKERLHKLIDRLPDSPETQRRLAAAEHQLEPNGSARVTKRTKGGGLSFFAIGAGDPTDAARRVSEFVGPAISRRHPAS